MLALGAGIPCWAVCAPSTDYTSVTLEECLHLGPNLAQVRDVSGAWHQYTSRQQKPCQGLPMGQTLKLRVEFPCCDADDVACSAEEPYLTDY